MPWKPLSIPPSAAAHLPHFLLSTDLTPSSYTVHLTDLTSIWCESLSHTDIIRRSREENTSIDPSSKDQLFIFLSKLRSGLTRELHTALELTINDQCLSFNRPSLKLHVKVDLPGGLRALEWPIHLRAAPQSLLTSQLIVPLLQAQYNLQRELALLAQLLNQKDEVIQKMLNKFEDQEIGLEQIFPHALGKLRKNLNQIHAKNRVKGLGAFDYDSWREDLDLTPNGTLAMADLTGEVFVKNSVRELPSMVIDSPEKGDWWKNMKGVAINLASGEISTEGMPALNPTKPQTKIHTDLENSTREGNSFQVQATVSHLVKAGASKTIARQWDDNNNHGDHDNDGDKDINDHEDDAIHSGDLNDLSHHPRISDSYHNSRVVNKTHGSIKVPNCRGILKEPKNTRIYDLVTESEAPDNFTSIEDEASASRTLARRPGVIGAKKSCSNFGLQLRAKQIQNVKARENDISSLHVPRNQREKIEREHLSTTNNKVLPTDDETTLPLQLDFTASNTAHKIGRTGKEIPTLKKPTVEPNPIFKPANPNPSSPAITQSKKTKLGIVIGKKTPALLPQSSPISSNHEVISNSTLEPPKISEVIRRTKHDYKEEKDVSTNASGRKINCDSNEGSKLPGRRETSEERVKRKRAELKRIAEVRSAKGSPKKQRKF